MKKVPTPTILNPGDALLVLLHDASGVPMKTCGEVLDAAADLQRSYVK